MKHNENKYKLIVAVNTWQDCRTECDLFLPEWCNDINETWYFKQYWNDKSKYSIILSTVEWNTMNINIDWFPHSKDMDTL